MTKKHHQKLDIEEHYEVVVEIIIEEGPKRGRWKEVHFLQMKLSQSNSPLVSTLTRYAPLPYIGK